MHSYVPCHWICLQVFAIRSGDWDYPCMRFGHPVQTSGRPFLHSCTPQFLPVLRNLNGRVMISSSLWHSLPSDFSNHCKNRNPLRMPRFNAYLSVKVQVDVDMLSCAWLASPPLHYYCLPYQYGAVEITEYVCSFPSWQLLRSLAISTGSQNHRCKATETRNPTHGHLGWIDGWTILFCAIDESRRWRWRKEMEQNPAYSTVPRRVVLEAICENLIYTNCQGSS